MGGASPSGMGDMPPLRQSHPTTQSQQPCQQATLYTPAVDVPRRVSFASKTSTSSGTPSYYSEVVKAPASTGGQPRGCSTERRTTSSSSGSTRPQDPYRRLHLKSHHRRGPETSLTLRAIEYMSQHMEEWLFEREQQPLWYMTYLTEVIKKVGGPTLTTMRKYTLWIKPGSFYNLRVYQLRELNKVSPPSEP